MHVIMCNKTYIKLLNLTAEQLLLDALLFRIRMQESLPVMIKEPKSLLHYVTQPAYLQHKEQQSDRKRKNTLHDDKVYVKRSSTTRKASLCETSL